MLFNAFTMPAISSLLSALSLSGRFSVKIATGPRSSRKRMEDDSCFAHAHVSSMFLRALGIFNRSSRAQSSATASGRFGVRSLSMLAVRTRRDLGLELLPQIEQIEPAPLLDQFAVFDANDGRERDRHVLAGRGNALKTRLDGCRAYSQAVCNAVTSPRGCPRASLLRRGRPPRSLFARVTVDPRA